MAMESNDRKNDEPVTTPAEATDEYSRLVETYLRRIVGVLRPFRADPDSFCFNHGASYTIGFDGKVRPTDVDYE